MQAGTQQDVFEVGDLAQMVSPKSGLPVSTYGVNGGPYWIVGVHPAVDPVHRSLHPQLVDFLYQTEYRPGITRFPGFNFRKIAGRKAIIFQKGDLVHLRRRMPWEDEGMFKALLDLHGSGLFKVEDAEWTRTTFDQDAPAHPQWVTLDRHDSQGKWHKSSPGIIKISGFYLTKLPI